MEDFESDKCPKNIVTKTDLKAWSELHVINIHKTVNIGKSLTDSKRNFLLLYNFTWSIFKWLNRTERIENIRKPWKIIYAMIFLLMKTGFYLYWTQNRIWTNPKRLSRCYRFGIVWMETLFTALIRATGAAIIDRIPPRMEIRRGAPIETPHIML